MSRISSATLESAMRLLESALQANQTRATANVKLMAAALQIQEQMAAEFIKMIEGLGQAIDVQA